MGSGQPYGTGATSQRAECAFDTHTAFTTNGVCGRRDNERDTRDIVIRQRILHDKAHPSFVRLPIIPR